MQNSEDKFFENVASFHIEDSAVDFFLKTLNLTVYKRIDSDGKAMVHDKFLAKGLKPIAEDVEEIPDEHPIIIHVMHGVRLNQHLKHVYSANRFYNIRSVRPKINYSMTDFFYKRENQIISDHYMKLLTSKDIMFIEVFKLINTKTIFADFNKILSVQRTAERKIKRKMKKMGIFLKDYTQEDQINYLNSLTNL